MSKHPLSTADADTTARTERLAAVGQLASGIAHDFSNLVTAIAFHADHLLAHMPDDPSLLERAGQIREAARRAGALTSQLLAFSRRRKVEPRRLDPNASIRDLRSLFHHFLGEDVEVVLDLQNDAGTVLVDPSQLEQVILNLAVNARDAMPDGGRLCIATSAVEMDATQAAAAGVAPGVWWCLTVSDSGIGIASATRERIFEPFFTTKGAEQGTGIGLSTVARVVEDAGGAVQVESEDGRGTTFRVLLPPADGAPWQAPSTPAGVEPGHDPRLQTVLVVEDERELRRLITEVLRQIGYQTLEAGDGAEAEKKAESAEAIDLVLVDLVMPDTRGPDLVARLRRHRPELTVIYMSGYVDSTDGLELDEIAGAPFIEKPFDGATLVRTVLTALEPEPC